MSWLTTKLKWTAATVAGGTPSVADDTFWADEGDGLAWVTISDMSGCTTVRSTGRRVTRSGISAARLPIGEPGTLILSMYASLGHTAYLATQASWNQAILGIYPTPSHDSRFLKYSLDAIKPTLTEIARSNTQANLNAEQVGNLAIPSPPLEDQRRIADFLDTETARIDRLRSLQTTVLARLNERESAILDLAIDDLVEHVGTTPFRRFINRMDQGSSPQCDAVPANDDEWGVLKVSCLRPGSFFADQNKRLPEGYLPDRRSEVREGDLLITRANTPQLVGSTAVVPDVRRKLLLSDKIFRVDVSSSLDPHYVALIARGSRVRSMSSASSNGASQSMANIRFEEVKEWPIPLISKEDQQKVVAEVNRSHKQTAALRACIVRQLDLLAERRQALITAAVTGQFDVSSASGRGVESP